MERAEFNRLVRDGLANLYDYAALETHPLASIFTPLPASRESRAEHLYQVLLRAIERLRPPEPECSPGSVEWRPYLILHGRYAERLSLPELQAHLSLSERQLRREHSRALQAVAAWLWDQAFPGQESPTEKEVTPEQWGSNFRTFEVAREPLDVVAIMRGVARTLARRVQSEGLALHLALPDSLPPVLADRVILRQILLSLLSHVLDARPGSGVTTSAQVQPGQVTLCIRFQEGRPPSPETSTGSAHLEAARYWAQRLGATLQVHPSGAEAGPVRLALSLPRAGRWVVLVVDDQEPAIRMFRRYLSRSNVQVIGVQEPEQVLPLVRQLQPQAITLDVMMPTMDGWEVLQALQADPETRHVPVIVCSVWNEPELAFSLGAAGFLKKPITQKDLLDALARLRLLDTPAGSCPEDSPG
jgi:CheY-like chemotaxis protein